MKTLRMHLSLVLIAILDRAVVRASDLTTWAQKFFAATVRIRSRLIEASEHEWKRYARRQPRLWCLVGGSKLATYSDCFAAVQKRHPGATIRQLREDSGLTRCFVGIRCVAEILPDPSLEAEVERNECIHARELYSHRVFLVETKDKNGR